MKLTTLAAASALAVLAAGAVQAQTLSVAASETPTTGGFNYRFVITSAPSTTPLNTLTFTFNDNAAFAGSTGTGFTGAPQVSSSTTTNSTDIFYNFPAPINQGNETFNFTSPTGNVVYGIAANGPGVAQAFNGTLSPTPEPGSLTSLAVLGGCLALCAAARRKASSIA